MQPVKGKFMRRLCLFFLVVVSLLLSRPSILPAENKKEEGKMEEYLREVEKMVTRPLKEIKVKLTVYDGETEEPIHGAHVNLDYDSKGRYGIPLGTWKCSDEADASTNHEGGTKLTLRAEKCPVISDEESLYLMVSAPGYATYQKDLDLSDTENVKISLFKLGYKKTNPPVRMEYPEYEMDLAVYEKSFNEINVINSLPRGKKIKERKPNYLVLHYAFAGSLGSEGFIDYLEKIQNASSLLTIPLLGKIVHDQYPLPYKPVIFNNSESPRLDEYVYEFGYRAVAKALLNISDDQVNDLHPLAAHIHEDYLRTLAEAGITLSAEDYWEYLSRRYESPQMNVVFGAPRYDQLEMVRSKLKDNLKPKKYATYLAKLYDHPRNQTDKNRIADELLEIDSPVFVPTVKRELPEMEAGYRSRKYMRYLYRQGEHEYLIESLKKHRNLLKAYLAEDVKETRSFNPKTGIERDTGVEECLIAKMPTITGKLKSEIETLLSEESKAYFFYRWWISNLAFVDREKAEVLAKDLYAKVKKSTKYETRDAKKYILRGATEAKLTGLCEDVYADLKVKEDLPRDYFSVGEYRIKYLYSACPSLMTEYVSNFDVQRLKEIEKTGRFEAVYGYGSDAKDSRDSIMQGVEKYFPRDEAIKILGNYYCGNDEVIESIYRGSDLFPKKYPINCLCETFKNDLPNLKQTTVSNLADYLNSCYPGSAGKYKSKRTPDWDREVSDRTYLGFLHVVKESKVYKLPKILWKQRLRAFFLGESPPSAGLEGEIDWADGTDSKSAFALLGQALASDDEVMRQAALLGYSFYPDKYTDEIVAKLKSYRTAEKYPEYLYATYSLAVHNPKEPAVRKAYTKVLRRHLEAIEERHLIEDKSEFVFNTLITLELSAMLEDRENYLKLLDLILRSDTIGGFEAFQQYLEEIISANTIELDEIIRQLINSSRPVDKIIGIRIAELKKYSLNHDIVQTLLSHDDSYVRLAAAKYIVANKEKYTGLFNSLKQNTNRKVRNLATSE